MRLFITTILHFSLYLILISYISHSFTLSILVEATPVSHTHPELWRHTEKEQHRPHLSKRITSIFPNSGHGSTTFNVIHVIAAVIGIVGAAILMIALVLYYKRKRRRLITEAAEVNTRSPYVLTSPTPPPPPSSSSSFNNGCGLSLSNTQASIPGIFSKPNSHHHHQSSNMSQFQVFQSDYCYDDEKQNLQTKKLIQNQPCPSSSASSTSYHHQFMPSPPPQCHAGQMNDQHLPYSNLTLTSSPPPYKP